MKKITRLLGVAVALYALPVFASPLYFHLKTTDGTFKVYNVDEINRLEFAGGKMNVVDRNDKIESFDMKDLDIMKVNDEISAVAEIADKSAWCTISGRMLTLSDSKDGISIYNVQGQLIVSISEAVAGDKVDLSSLPKGIYVVTNGSEAAKFEL